MGGLPLEPATPAFPTAQIPTSSPLTFNMDLQVILQPRQQALQL